MKRIFCLFLVLVIGKNVFCQNYSVISLDNGHNYIADLNKLDSIWFTELYPSDSSISIPYLCSDSIIQLFDDVTSLSAQLYRVKMMANGSNLLQDCFYGETRGGITLSVLDTLKYEMNGIATDYTTFYINRGKPIIVDEGEQLAILYRAEDMPRLSLVCRFTKNGIPFTWDTYGDDQIVTVPKGADGLIIGIQAVKNSNYNKVVIQPKVVGTSSADFVMSLYNKSKWKKKPKPMLTIIDDDGSIKFKKYLLPIIKEENISIATACTGKGITEAENGNEGLMRWTDIIECYNVGAEVISHSFNHVTEATSSEFDEYQIQFDYQKMKNLLNSHGIFNDGLVYAGNSGYVPKCINACKKVYKYGFKASVNKTNYIDDINRYGIFRYGINPDYDDLVEKIDKLMSDGTGWMVWMIHTGASEFQQAQADALKKAIVYAKSKGLDVVNTECGVAFYLEGRE